MVAADTILRMRDVSKRFGRVQANDSIDLELRRGEVLGLLGENGAGKTTLMSILFGHYVADSGEIEAFGKTLRQGNMRASLEAGIGMVQQHFALADNLTVLGNIVAGTESLLRLGFGLSAARQKIEDLSERCGFAVPIDATIKSLSVGERQKVEILKVLYQDARILVLDEPTAVLTPQESKALFATIRRLTEQGLSVILISHKLEEVLEASDRICVLRHGKLTYSASTADASEEEIIRAMVGHEIVRTERTDTESGETLLRMDKVRVGKWVDSEVSLELREREILGVTGVSGNGQSEMCEVLNGLSRPRSGKVAWFGSETAPEAGEMTDLKVARIPDDRGHLGINGDMAVAENMVSNRYRDYSRWGFLDRGTIKRDAEKLADEFDVRCDSVSIESRLLSGGNIQKLILARELSIKPRVIIANQPTRGLDVGAINEVHRLLLEAKEAGAGVLLVTEELDELFELSDRVAVMFRGRLSDFTPLSGIDVQQVGLMMSGSSAAT